MAGPLGRWRGPSRAVRGVALAALAAYAASAGLGVGGPAFARVAHDWLYLVPILAAAALCLARALLAERERAPWALLGAALVGWSGGELYYVLHLEGVELPPYPSLSDALYLTFYPASYVALVLLVRARMREFRSSLWLDGVIAALAVAATGAALGAQPILDATGGTAASVAADLAYPLGDLILLAIVAGVFALTGWRPGRTWGYIGAGLALAALADALFLYLSAAGSYTEGGPLDALWPAAALLLAHAAWQPSRRPRPIGYEGWRLLVIPVLFALTALALLLYDAHFGRVNDIGAALAGATLVAVIARLALLFVENTRMIARSRLEALTDPLTGLGNRRRLMAELAAALDDRTGGPWALIAFDLDGFKRYNDTFGHPAGDALLTRLGGSLAAAVAPHGSAYRLGGDEFCALVALGDRSLEATVRTASGALSEVGGGFEVRSSYGCVRLPEETRDPALALQIADQRLYADKGGRARVSAGQQASRALLQALAERQPHLRGHGGEVAELAAAIGRRLGLGSEQLHVLASAAELHDVGKVAIPDAVLQKAGELDEGEWGLIRQHTVIGERILNAAPVLGPVARIVRSTHERHDGGGYPDGLAGEEIPLGARIIAACDAFQAMVSERPYRRAMSRRQALAELRRCAGSHFDPVVIDALCAEAAVPPAAREAVAESGASPAPAARRPATAG